MSTVVLPINMGSVTFPPGSTAPAKVKVLLKQGGVVMYWAWMDMATNKATFLGVGDGVYVTEATAWNAAETVVIGNPITGSLTVATQPVTYTVPASFGAPTIS